MPVKNIIAVAFLGVIIIVMAWYVQLDMILALLLVYILLSLSLGWDPKVGFMAGLFLLLINYLFVALSRDDLINYNFVLYGWLLIGANILDGIYRSFVGRADRVATEGRRSLQAVRAYSAQASLVGTRRAALFGHTIANIFTVVVLRRAPQLGHSVWTLLASLVIQIAQMVARLGRSVWMAGLQVVRQFWRALVDIWRRVVAVSWVTWTKVIVVALCVSVFIVWPLPVVYLLMVLGFVLSAFFGHSPAWLVGLAGVFLLATGVHVAQEHLENAELYAGYFYYNLLAATIAYGLQSVWQWVRPRLRQRFLRG
ncbi:hypothetical protein HY933_02395 [Candidatus Falkowbacteria bacterium]|nr:hypothetical protein [Candidatus Falkowbacteria bacterium]